VNANARDDGKILVVGNRRTPNALLAQSKAPEFRER